MKRISMDYTEYVEDLALERRRMVNIFEPLLKTVQHSQEFFLGQVTTEPSLSHEDILKRIFKSAEEVRINWEKRSKI